MKKGLLLLNDIFSIYVVYGRPQSSLGRKRAFGEKRQSNGVELKALCPVHRR
jgi:hypothetical protein